jgi:serine/threonine-protein kinase haspin
MDDLAHGVRGTLIDLGLSRMDAGDGAGGERVHWTPFDDEIFMGEGETAAYLLTEKADGYFVL